jgi:hypothetical protein
VRDYKKNRMEFLKRKNRRSNLIKELSNIITVSNESLLEMEANDSFCKKVFEILNTLESKISIQEQDYENISIKLIREIIDKNEFSKNVGRVLFFRDEEVEAVELNISELSLKLEEILGIATFTMEYGDFILVDNDLKFGISIESAEYQYEFYSWGTASR